MRTGPSRTSSASSSCSWPTSRMGPRPSPTSERERGCCRGGVFPGAGVRGCPPQVSGRRGGTCERSPHSLLRGDHAHWVIHAPRRSKIKCRVETASGQWVDRIPAWVRWATQEWNEIQYNGEAQGWRGVRWPSHMIIHANTHTHIHAHTHPLMHTLTCEHTHACMQVCTGTPLRRATPGRLIRTRPTPSSTLALKG
jgi:hypothetical protein